MKTAKIQEIKWFNEWTNPKSWRITYYFNLKMDNWEEISLWKMNKDAFKLWDSVNYEEYTDDKWKQRFREVRPDNWYRKSFQQDQRGYFTSIAFQIAFQSYSWEDSYKYCSDLARRIFADMLDNYENKQPEENGNTDQNIESSAKKEEENDLPF